MAKHYVSKSFSPIIFELKRNHLKKIDLCRAMNISEFTLDNYIKQPELIRLRDLRVMAGMFGINLLHLVYCLERNKPQVKKDDKWYIESAVNKRTE